MCLFFQVVGDRETYLYEYCTSLLITTLKLYAMPKNVTVKSNGDF